MSCERCSGKGYIREVDLMLPCAWESVKCPSCNGTGKMEDAKDMEGKFLWTILSTQINRNEKYLEDINHRIKQQSDSLSPNYQEIVNLATEARILSTQILDAEFLIAKYYK